MATVQSAQPFTDSPSIHKRGHSSSAISFRISNSRTHDQDMNNPPSPTSAGHSINLKPYLRKLSLRDTNSNVVDFSRSYAENQSIAGLAFYDDARSGSDLAFPHAGPGNRHQRSTSNNSNFSISSNPQRPSAPYAFPMRHTPRPYTPPIARSFTANSSNSEASDEVDDIMSVEDFRSKQRVVLDPSRRSGSIGSLPVAPQPYNSYSNSSLTRLNNVSQTSLPTSRSRGDTMRSIETVPSSRTSMDRAMGFLRSNSKTDDDPATRAATIQAARLAFAEREEAKERKAEKDHLKAQDKAEKKQRQKEEKTRRRSESIGTPINMTTTSLNEKPGLISRAYDDIHPTHSRSLPAHITTASTAAAVDAGTSRASRKSQSSSFTKRWQGFLAWFRTRLLRMQRKTFKNPK